MMVMDASGNTASSSSLVYVPKNNGGSAIDDGLAYEEICAIERAPMDSQNNAINNGANDIYNLDVKYWPNPSNSNFNLRVTTDIMVEPINIMVFDVNGRILHSNTFNPQDTYQFGSELMTGLYFVKVTQANKTEIIKVVKH